MKPVRPAWPAAATVGSRLALCLSWVLCPASAVPLRAEDPATEAVTAVEFQPLAAATARLLEAMTLQGSPLPQTDADALRRAISTGGGRDGVIEIQKILDPHCIALVRINPESRVSVGAGPAPKGLIEQGWRTFLVKVHNEAGVTAELKIGSPQARPNYQQGAGGRERPQRDQKLVTPQEAADRFIDIDAARSQPLAPRLSGLTLEYRLVHLFSRDAGQREATLVFDVGQGTQDLGFRSEVPILFSCQPATRVVLDVRDEDGSPTTAAFTILDRRGRVYPHPTRRLAPDFFFHHQVYRATGETVTLPPGEYSVTVQRGPEYLTESLSLVVRPGVVDQRLAVRMRRWIHPAKRHWFSGDHHVHAAGCGHYDSPTEGVGPADMMRHVLGEDLNVGCVLSWGPCWYTQKQHFEGRVHALSRPDYVMRYDVEVSGFPSSHAGHLCLLRLREDDYPGTTVLEDWPSWTLPVLEWARAQGGVVGYSHSGWGLALPDLMPDGSRQFRPQPAGGADDDWTGRCADTLPDFAIPKFDGIGANEFIVTGALGACDFVSTVDTPAIWELNVWYHTLNAGVRTRISGETDFPCIYGERVGLGRVYVKLDDGQPLDFDAWCEGLRDGRSYCGDGLSHVLDLKVADRKGRAAAAGDGTAAVRLGEPGPGGGKSLIDLHSPGTVDVAFDVAALLAESPSPATERIRTARLDSKPYWHIERCRIGDTRMVPVEIVRNGMVVHRREIEADGRVHSIAAEIDMPESSWVAVRILPSVHTNPIWVSVGGRPVRVPASAAWCRDAVDVCWESKKNAIRDSELGAAEAAYRRAREFYEGR